ncbi:Maf family protein [Conexibacter sp. JD483]|uniref:Maf family protein n=1 Tax=unclassified Conexibacter TaxID=2627773 RepID=UPI0027271EC0|nr:MULTISPECIES: Maf family protein [unclassified Conexibacter]MDO8187631.1 Maf family protein [Conexibacter sp. CPCC 205706]MDO8201037.1 Maf family protein [Conexibacter sp. CPCC 205762]MDR9371210.1 Maf family protein [Conexibacter sp. JD483]
MLASRSPQRRAILTQLGVPFAVRPADVEELAAGDPAVVAVENALRKATALAGDPAVVAAGQTILGVDTIVVIGGEIHGKPDDAPHARRTLAALAGRDHHVLSGIAVVDPAAATPRTALAQTRVRFRQLDDTTLDWYVATGEWEGRAGGYAIQERGAALIAEIDGDYLNVVGLPVAALLELLPALLQEAV